MRYATVRFGIDDEEGIILVTIPFEATQEKCDGCGVDRHIIEIIFWHDSRPLCRGCYIKQYGLRLLQITVPPS